MPIPVSDQVLAKNIETTITDIITLLADADRVNTRARTVYYKCILLLAASILEALVYDFIKCHCQADESLLSRMDGKKLNYLQELSSSTLGSEKKLWIAEEVSDIATIKSVTYNSKPMNKFCLDCNLIDENLFEDLEYARQKRNQIHLQTLDSTSRSYTVRMIERIGSAIDTMYDKLEDFNPSLRQTELVS
jgi:hypothetical protein